MQFMGQEFPLSISLTKDTYKQAEKFAKAGFEAAECCLPPSGRDPMDLEQYEPYIQKVYPFIKNAGLRVHSYHLPYGMAWDVSSPDEYIRTHAVQALKQVIPLLEPLEGENMVLHPSFEPIREDEREAHIAACMHSVAELEPFAREHGKRIALENLPRTCLGRVSEEMERLTDGGRLCGICMDTTHMFHETPQDFLARNGKWVINIHLSDYLNGQDECHWVPGTGSLNWKEILLKLKELGYQGTYNFEVFKYEPLEIIGGLANALNR